MAVSGIYRRTKVGPFVVLEGRYSPEVKSLPHSDGSLRLSIVLRGQVREDSGTRTELGTTASVAVKPADARHANSFGPGGAHLLSTDIPDESILKQGQLESWAWHHGGPVTREAIRFVETYRDQAVDAQGVEERVYALIDAVDEKAGGSRPRTHPPRWLERVQHRIHDEFTQTYSVADLARTADVHPVYLARAFRRHYCCTVSEYVQRLRVRRAAASLASNRLLPLVQVAQDVGFFDQSHFCRAFKREFGQTPGRARSLLTPAPQALTE